MDVNKIHEMMREKVFAGDVKGAASLAGQAVQEYLNKIGDVMFPMRASNAVFAFVAMHVHAEYLESLLDDNDKELAELLLSNSKVCSFTAKICPNGKEE